MNKIVELKNVLKLYKRGAESVHALDGISLSVGDGEFLAIVGPSGSGKTTILNLIGCVDRSTSGSIKVDSTEIENLKEKELTRIRANTIGFVFQQFFLLPTLTALENVQLPTIFSSGNSHNSTKKAKRLMKLVGLSNRESHLPSQLSGGEMQRVAIARALINDPKILLSDEPTGNLDSGSAKTVMDIFKKLNGEGLTIVMVTHNLPLTELATRVIYLHDGKIINGV